MPFFATRNCPKTFTRKFRFGLRVSTGISEWFSRRLWVKNTGAVSSRKSARTWRSSRTRSSVRLRPTIVCATRTAPRLTGRRSASRSSSKRFRRKRRSTGGFTEGLSRPRAWFTKATHQNFSLGATSTRTWTVLFRRVGRFLRGRRRLWRARASGRNCFPGRLTGLHSRTSGPVLARRQDRHDRARRA